MLLLAADLFKSFWFLLAPAVAMSRGVQTNDVFCQVGGFFVQMGLQACGKLASVRSVVQMAIRMLIIRGRRCYLHDVPSHVFPGIRFQHRSYGSGRSLPLSMGCICEFSGPSRIRRCSGLCKPRTGLSGSRCFLHSTNSAVLVSSRTFLDP